MVQPSVVIRFNQVAGGWEPNHLHIINTCCLACTGQHNEYNWEWFESWSSNFIVAMTATVVSGVPSLSLYISGELHVVIAVHTLVVS